VLFGLIILNLLSKFTLASPCSSGVVCLRVELASNALSSEVVLTLRTTAYLEL